jgi:hypothetical protein
MTSREVLAMRNVFYYETHTGADRHASRPFSLLETMLVESEGEDGNVQTERVIWTWKVHEVALHEASQREGLLMIGGSKEVLLKKVSEEVTRKAQEKLRVARSNSEP